jgi:hypothetical protein
MHTQHCKCQLVHMLGTQPKRTPTRRNTYPQHTHRMPGYPTGFPWQAWVSVERAQRACPTPRKDADLPFHDVTRAVAPVDAQPARLFIGRQRRKMQPSPISLVDVSSQDTDGLVKAKVRRWATAGNCR